MSRSFSQHLSTLWRIILWRTSKHWVPQQAEFCVIIFACCNVYQAQSKYRTLYFCSILDRCCRVVFETCFFCVSVCSKNRLYGVIECDPSVMRELDKSVSNITYPTTCFVSPGLAIKFVASLSLWIVCISPWYNRFSLFVLLEFLEFILFHQKWVNLLFWRSQFDVDYVICPRVFSMPL